MAQFQQKEYKMFKLAYSLRARGLSSNRLLSQETLFSVGQQPMTCAQQSSQGPAVLVSCAVSPNCLSWIKCTLVPQLLWFLVQLPSLGY